jgi:hypothetical protein
VTNGHGLRVNGNLVVDERFEPARGERFGGTQARGVGGADCRDDMRLTVATRSRMLNTAGNI